MSLPAEVAPRTTIGGSVAPAAGAVVIRLVRPDEHDAVGDLLERAYGADYVLSAAYLESLHAVRERAAEHQVWVAVDEYVDALLGTVATPRAGRTISELALPEELDFRLLGVDPAARRRGIGRLLTEHVIALGRERGATRVVMNSGPQMLGAHRLYHSLGFRRLPERETRVVEAGTLLAFGLDLDRTHHRTES